MGKYKYNDELYLEHVIIVIKSNMFCNSMIVTNSYVNTCSTFLPYLTTSCRHPSLQPIKRGLHSLVDNSK